MQFKTRTVKREFYALTRHNPALQSLLLWINLQAQYMFHKEITVTSIHREDDPPSPHNLWRAADLRVTEAVRTVATNDMTRDEWRRMLKLVNRKFIYGRKADGTETVCAHLLLYPSRPENNHVHVQTPSGVWHGQGGIA